MRRNLIISLILVVVLVTGCSLLPDESEPLVAPTVTVDRTPTTSATAVATQPGLATAPPVETPLPATEPAVSTPTAPAGAAGKLAYFHIAPTDGEPAATLAEHASFVTLTSGDEAYRTQLRAAGYTGVILQFLVASEVNGPGPYRDAAEACDDSFKPLRNGIAREQGEFCRDIHVNEDWFLHNGAGARLYTVVGDTGVWYHMNPANENWRAYALSHMLRDLSGDTTLGYDGIFLDNVEVSPVRVQTMLDNSDGTIAELPSDEAFVEAWAGYLEDLATGLRPFGQLWGNMVSDTNDGDSWDAYLPYLDGVMSPAFATGYHGLTSGKWLNNIQQTESALESGKGVVAVGLGARDNEQQQQFAFGSYLLVMNADHAFFRYVSNESSVDFSSFWLYPNYALRLGNPTGPRYRDGLNWRRDFACGTVLVRPSQQTADITLTGECD